MRHRLVLLIAIVLSALAIVACEPENHDEQDATKSEQQKQSDTYQSLVETQPARGMSYSPSRDTANKWAETWEEQGKLSYVYLIDSVGHQVGYYILKGLPVNYCASLTPPDKVERHDFYENGVAVTRSAPAIDGMYYGGSNCQQYYGYDAVSGAYLEFTGGGSFNYLLSDQPMTNVDSQPLGDATIESVESKK